MIKKLVILYSSPRPQGFTKQLLNHFQSQFPLSEFEMEWIDVCSLQVSPCIDCRACLQGPCPWNQKDDYEGLLESLETATHILIASPIYFAGFPAPLKAVVDRSQQFFMNRANNRVRRYPLRRKGALLLTAGASDERVSQAVLLSGEMFFRCLNADLSAHYILECTDFLEQCPPLPTAFWEEFR